MFSSDQLRSLDKGYFIVIQATSYSITLQSRCTGHQWHICGSGYGNEVILDHRHSAHDPWHRQAFYGCRHDFKGAISAIRAHDRYQLKRNRKRKMEKNKKRVEATCPQ